MQSCTGTSSNESRGSFALVRWIRAPACRIRAATAEPVNSAHSDTGDRPATADKVEATSSKGRGLHKNSLVYRNLENEYRILPHRTCRLTAPDMARLCTTL